MTDRLIQLLGLEVPAGGKAHFEWGQLPRGELGLLWVAVIVGLVALTGWIYRREGRASALRKVGLALLRLLALAIVALVLLEPRLAIDMQRTVEGNVIVLWDTSLSMSLEDRYEPGEQRDALAAAADIADPEDLATQSRHELAWRIVERSKLLPGLAARNTLVVYGFDQEPRRLAAAPTAGDELAPRGPATDIELAVRRALEEQGGRRIAAVVLVSDGRITRGEGGQSVAAALRPRGVPFFAIGVGDPIPPRNLEVAQVGADPRVILGDPIVIEGAVRSRGYEGQPIEVKLVIRPREGGPEVVLERHVAAPPDGDTVEVTFEHTPTAVGELVCELVVPARDEEPIKDDNVRSVVVRVTDDVTKVLLIAGSPTFEYHVLKTRLIRERATLVSCWLQSAAPRFPQEGNERIDAMPSTLELLEPYDAIVLLDPDPDDFDAGTIAAYKSFVADHKGGLLYVPGPKWSSTFLARPDLSPLRDLLPVLPGEPLDSRGAGTEQWPMRATPDGSDHPATRLDPNPERCKLLWSRLPGFFWSYPVVREKAGAAVLVRHEDPSTATERGARPLVVAHFFDGGPVAWLGSEETWRWRATAERVYDRFWVGLLRFLVQGRIAGGRKRLELLTDKDEYVLGEPIRVRAHAFDRSYQPLDVRALEATLRAAKQDEVPLQLLPAGGTQKGWYEATVLPPAQGALEVSMRLPDAEPGTPPETVTVEVRPPDIELEDPSLDEALLATIAAETSGAVVKPAEVAALADRIPSLREPVTVAGAPIPLWDRWEVVAAIVALLGLEWAIRKRSRMV